MAASFNVMTAALDAAVMAALNDGLADYLDAAGNPVASDVTVIVDRNLERAGADGMFISIPLAITWRKVELSTAISGGVFTLGTERYLVEGIVSDDGYMITASCMETR
ncbi:hypothetical protein ACFOJE_21195 [Azotobacter bryophylli]|uniref:Uncharacterized protein n=1 Tax=Azotobacter bryophylli TaxID=1986537 RepID=A0ABV7B1U5_9GAMM